MIEKRKNYVVVIMMIVFFLTFAIWIAIKPIDRVSKNERRNLAGFPAFKAQSVASGRFMKEFENYSMDQFPMRDQFRRIKANVVFHVFGQKDYNGIYEVDGYLSKLEYPMEKESLLYATEKFKKIYENYLDKQGVSVYLSVIPDKNMFLNPQEYPCIDYESFISLIREKTDFMEYIEIKELLNREDFYKTDTHWRQERIGDVADRLVEKMLGKKPDKSWEYERKISEIPFYGVYAGQSGLKVPGEELAYLTSEHFKQVSVYDYETGKEIPIYDMEKMGGRDPYEGYLSGSKSLLTIHNPQYSTGKKLLIFRDSFASSLIPLLIEHFSEITVVDIRYLSSDRLGNFIDFQGYTQEDKVLFLYSTLVLNQSSTLK